MPYTITNQCIGCVSVASPQMPRCYSACPTGAIKKVNQHYQIDPTICNNCVGFYNVPQCWASCPTNKGCIPVLDKTECDRPGLTSDYWDSWFATYNRMVSRLKTAKHTKYWQQWFDAYATQLSKNLQAHHC